MSMKLSASPMCPWCGDEANDTPEDLPFSFADDSVSIECGGCERPITIRRVVTVAYACEKREEFRPPTPDQERWWGIKPVPAGGKS